jgi:CRP/FNR family transcriptional regulator, anaerobic regulatory protein
MFMQRIGISEFQDYLRLRTQLSDSDLERVCSLAVPRVLRRNELLFSEGEVCRHKAYVAKGLLRTFSISPDGAEHILQFSPEQTWIVDAESYDKQIPSKYTVAAVDDSELLLWNKPDFDRLLAETPALKRFSEVLISRAVYSTRERLASALSATPEERYNAFVRDSPALMKRLPLRMIAAYLGISIKTLTRLRHAQLQR